MATQPVADPETASGGRRLKSFDYKGHRVVYEVHGEGPRTMILTHGILLDATLNRALAQALAGHGHRVVLPEMLGHGRSDRPRHAAEHRMDRYAEQIRALMDHLGVEQAVVGGTSLGANIALHVAVDSPHRVRGMFLEMPVLEWAAPACGTVMIPWLLWATWFRPVDSFRARVLRRVPRSGFDVVDTLLNAGSMDPREVASILHGILIGPVAPTVDERRSITAPTLILGHERDAIHPFSDATNLAEQLPNARLIQARSVLELRTRPTRLTQVIADFLEDVWQPRPAADPVGS